MYIFLKLFEAIISYIVKSHPSEKEKKNHTLFFNADKEFTLILKIPSTIKISKLYTYIYSLFLKRILDLLHLTHSYIHKLYIFSIYLTPELLFNPPIPRLTTFHRTDYIHLTHF